MPRGATSLYGPAQRSMAAALFLVCLLPATALGQAQGSFGHPDESRIVLRTAPNTGIVTFKVFGERNGAHLDRQAVVKLVSLSNQAATWQPTSDNSESVFTDVPYGDYDAEVSAVGYLSSHQDLKIISIRSTLQFDIVLQRDPAAINLDLGDAVMSPKARKGTKRAISALKSGNLNEARKQLDEAYKSAPSSPELNFLLGYLYFQKKDFSQAGT